MNDPIKRLEALDRLIEQDADLIDAPAMTNDKDSAVLLPCPFCGGEAEYFKRTNTGAVADWCGPSQHWVCCIGDCGNQTCLHETPEQAIAAWNKRQPTQSDPDAMRYSFDGFGYKYIDSGSGSDWRTRHSDAEPLYLSQPESGGGQQRIAGGK